MKVADRDIEFEVLGLLPRTELAGMFIRGKLFAVDCNANWKTADTIKVFVDSDLYILPGEIVRSAFKIAKMLHPGTTTEDNVSEVIEDAAKWLFPSEYPD